MIRKALSLTSLAGLLAFGSVHAGGGDAALREFVESNIRPILDNALVMDGITAQNENSSSLSQSEIDSLDQKWRAETDGAAGDLIDSTLNTPLSDYLSGALEQGDGVYTEIFVMDNRGLNVGQSGLTSDYWQGDEGKWQETFLVGENAIHTSEIEFDESSQTYQLQISVSIVDPDSSVVIGAATFGVNAEALQMISLDDLQ